MRSEFEKMPEISEILSDEKSHFNGDFYVLPFNSCAESFINGAWYAFQHQQSKIDELQKRVDAVKALIEEYRDPPTEDKTFCHALSIVAYELEQVLNGGE